MLFIVLIIATVLVAFWIVLLFGAEKEDWRLAAFNKVLANMEQIEKLKAKDRKNAAKLEELHGLEAKLGRLLYGGSSEKKIAKLREESARIQQGNLKYVGVLDIPGYVLQRRAEKLGQGSFHKEAVTRFSELYGKKYADSRAKRLMAQLISYPIIGIALALILGAIEYGAGEETTGLAIMGIGALLVVFIAYAQYDELQDRVKKRRAAISRQFPNVVSKLALLVTSGMIMDRAWKETAESSDGELYLEMRKTAEERQNMVDPATAYANFIDRCETKETSKLASAIIQNQSKGNAEIGRLLKDMAHEAWQERRNGAKKEAENANSKLMIPTMLLLLAILVMIMVPIAESFSSF